MINKTKEKVKMMKKNMLIKTEDISIFRRILNFFKSILHKKENNTEYNSELQETRQEINIINEFEEKRKIKELQQNYETNVIREEDLTEREKENLIELYKEQIDTIENNIQTELKKLEFYKQKIILAKEKAKLQKNMD